MEIFCKKIGKIFLIALLTFNFFVLTTKAVVKSYQAQKVSQSYSGAINLQPKKSITISIRFKNIGASSWYNYGSKKVFLRARGVKFKSSFYYKSWLNGKDPALLLEKVIKPGETGTLKFALTAPSDPGFYTVKFDLMVGGEKIEGGGLEIPLNVISAVAKKSVSQTTGSDSNKSNFQTSSPSSNSNQNSYQVSDFSVSEIKEDKNLLPQGEPKIRIGLFSNLETVKIKASGSYEIKDQNNKLIFSQKDGAESDVSFDLSSKKQALKINNEIIVTTDSYLRFVPVSGAIFEIINYKNSPAWNKNLNDNQFKGILETRYSPESGKFWVVEEINLEDYLKGMAEVENSSPIEFLKSFSIAARTYAAYYILNPAKHDIFNLNTTDGDQVYRGYGMEKRSPNLSRAINETKGLFITYNNELVKAPYFSQSDGRTRSWSEVWSGTRAWLVSKPDPYCKGKKLLGHGVGMSNSGARALAQDGKNFGQILKYYYTGIEIKKAY